jgi:uncharacterized protein YbcI
MVYLDTCYYKTIIWRTHEGQENVHQQVRRWGGQRQGQAEELIRKKQLLIARKASKLFIKKGYSQTTMREISRTTGINLGNLYNFIDSKEDILCMVFHMFHNPTTDWMAKDGILDIDDPVEQMRVSLRKVLELIHEYKDEIFLMYRERRFSHQSFSRRSWERKAPSSLFSRESSAKGWKGGSSGSRIPSFPPTCSSTSCPSIPCEAGT